MSTLSMSEVILETLIKWFICLRIELHPQASGSLHLSTTIPILAGDEVFVAVLTTTQITYNDYRSVQYAALVLSRRSFDAT